MALSSPGVQVTIIDQSQYLPAASSSVPLVVVATAQNKINAAGTGVAAATTAANASKLYLATSQRDLVNLYGNPFFYKTTNGTSIHGYELNEYGLMAAYSLLGATNRAYILRADIDLAALVGQVSRPVGAPANGTYWLDTTNSSWGIYEFSLETGKFTNQTPIVIAETDLVSGGYPKASIGNIGDYAVISYQQAGSSIASKGTYFYKSVTNTWTKLGASDWKSAVPVVVGATSPTLTMNDTFDIKINNGASLSVTIPAGESVDSVVTAIANLNITGLTAANLGGALAIYLDDSHLTDENNTLTLTDTSGTPLQDLGIITTNVPAVVKYVPKVVFGTSAQMPLWTSSQQYPHPTGSVWIKTSTSGSGMDLVLSKYSTAAASWSAVDVAKYTDDEEATATLDSSGGKSIPAGSVYVQYSGDISRNNTVVKLWERLASGSTVVTGTVSNPTITSGATISVMVSVPGSIIQEKRQFTTNGTTATSFVTSWLAANIPYTSATVTTDGAVQLVHTAGGQIYLTDINQNGQSSGVIHALGFDPDVTLGVKLGNFMNLKKDVNPTAKTSTNSNADMTTVLLSVDIRAGVYSVTNVSGGTNFAVSDTLTFSGSSLGGATPANNLVVTVTSVDGQTGAVTSVAYKQGTAATFTSILLSNWVELEYVANEGSPAAIPANGTQWFYSSPTQVDIMVNKNGVWKGYGKVAFDSHGHPAASGTVGATNSNGIILSTTAPTLQDDGTALVYGDLWLDTGDLENYPVISRWQDIDGVDQWVLINNTDQTSANGILFADARWGKQGDVDPVNDPMPTIGGTNGLWNSDYVDLDCPDPSLYPQGMLLFNTRRSGYNVKKFAKNYFTGAAYPNAGAFNSAHPTYTTNLPEVSYTWVTVSGLKADGSAYMGRKAQRAMVVKAMKAALSTNMAIREEDTFFNLIATPGYPELQPDMITLNNDRNNTAYIVGDTPLRLSDSATEITSWANNTAGATSSGEDGWVSRDSYLGVFYPSGITTDLSGSQIVVPASHMMLRTLLRNDTIAYPWFAPAGTRRGLIDNATNIGYLDATTGEFQTVKNRMSIRDVLYTNQINPLAYFTGVGLLNYGNKNSFDSQSAMDRTNVARLIAYIRERVQVAARPFVFEPNDSMTRSELTGVIQSLFVDLVAKRGLYDYLVVCDDTNNTPARIDRNELWVDIAIEPVKAAEFIYIPVRILNTGELNG